MCTALMTFGGACGGIISGNIFRAQDAPSYIPGILVCMCFQVSFDYGLQDAVESNPGQILTILLVSKNFIYYSWCNRRAKRGELVIQGQPEFRYTL